MLREISLIRLEPGSTLTMMYSGTFPCIKKILLEIHGRDQFFSSNNGGIRKKPLHK